MKPLMNVCLNSEIGQLRGVILHSPGSEVSSMSPSEISGALYSDIINTSIAHNEYYRISSVLSMLATTYEVTDLLENILKDEKLKMEVLKRIEESEPVIGECYHGVSLKDRLMDTDAKELAMMLVEGVELERDNVQRFFSRDRYALSPMYNFFFTRDASMAIGDKVLSGRMANKVRDRESVLMKAIFDLTPEFNTETIDLSGYDKGEERRVTIEGGDFLVVSDNVLIIGCGVRTSAKAIDALIEELMKNYERKDFHVLIQELPHSPESFIHLDMVFTLLDRNYCMVYEPVIFSHGQYRVAHVHVAGGRLVSITEEENLVLALNGLGFELEPIYCGGKTPVGQQREQWHSGANFFAVAPGKVMGYARNHRTVEAMNNAGFDIFRAIDIIDGKVDLNSSQKYFITIEVSELTRGGGGIRCMTMPINRLPV